MLIFTKSFLQLDVKLSLKEQHYFFFFLGNDIT